MLVPPEILHDLWWHFCLPMQHFLAISPRPRYQPGTLLLPTCLLESFSYNELRDFPNFADRSR